MKTYLLASLVTLATVAPAAPLQKTQVPAEAKWLLHLDLDAFRATKLGQFISKTFIEKGLVEPKAELRKSLDFDLDWTKLSSLTAYGTDYGAPDAQGVLLLKTDADTQQKLLGVLLLATQAGKLANGALARVQEEPLLYSLANNLFIAPQKGGSFLLGKSRERLQKAAAVLAGDAPNLNSREGFSGLFEPPNSFFFLAVAEGLGETILKAHAAEKGAHANGMPPQAQILRMAEAGRIALGEAKDRLLLNLALRAKTVEASQEMQQVVQGIIALVSLGQAENPDLQQLAQSTKVASRDRLMTISLEYPVAKVLEKISQPGAPWKKALKAHGESGLRKKARPATSDQKPERESAPE